MLSAHILMQISKIFDGDNKKPLCLISAMVNCLPWLSHIKIHLDQSIHLQIVSIVLDDDDDDAVMRQCDDNETTKMNISFFVTFTHTQRTPELVMSNLINIWCSLCIYFLLLFSSCLWLQQISLQFYIVFAVHTVTQRHRTACMWNERNEWK